MKRLRTLSTTPSGWAVAGSNPGSSKEGYNVWSIGKRPAPNSVPYVPQHIDGKLNCGWSNPELKKKKKSALLCPVRCWCRMSHKMDGLDDD